MKRRTFIAAVLTALPAAGQVVPFTFSDPQIYRSGTHALPICDSYDDMESYSVAAGVNGLNGGPCWFGPYVSTDFLVQDNLESYTLTAMLGGLNGGTSSNPFWGSAYVDRAAPPAFTPEDDMESYTVSANLDGLNGGPLSQPYWGSAYADRATRIEASVQDNLEGYSVAASLNSLNGGQTLWGGAYVDR